MKLYEINHEIDALVDNETGEILDFKKFQELEMAEKDKLEAISLHIKNNEVSVKALKEEAKKLLDRANVIENKNSNTKEFLSNYMRIRNINKIETSKCVLSFRKSSKVIVDDEEKFIKKYKYSNLVKQETKFEINKKATKDFLKKGDELLYAHIEESKNLQIK